MSAKPRSFAASASVTLMLALVAAPAFAGDPVQQSFVRMLAPREPIVVPAAAAPAPADPLIAALVVPLRDGVWPVRRVDPVAESFARLFNHESSWATPSAPAGDADPLIAAVVQPLLRSSQITVAARHAPRSAH